MLSSPPPTYQLLPTNDPDSPRLPHSYVKLNGMQPNYKNPFLDETEIISVHNDSNLSHTGGMHLGYRDESRHMYEMNKLPDEVLGMIFKFSLVEDDIPSLYNPYLLASICKHWRRVVFSTPSLWDTLWIYEGGGEPGHYGLYSSSKMRLSNRPPPDGFENEIVRWLKRARGNMELHLHLKHSDYRKMKLSDVLRKTFGGTLKVLYISADPGQLQNFANLLAQSRFPPCLAGNEELSGCIPLNLPELWSLWKYKLYGTSNLNSLEKLALTLTGKSYPKFKLDISSLEKLKHLTLVNLGEDQRKYSTRCSFFQDRLISGIPYSQLTVLNVAEPQLSQAQTRTMLKRCSNLESCSLRHIERTRPQDVRLVPGPIRLHKLKSFSITFQPRESSREDHTSVTSFFQAMETPAMEIFELFSLEGKPSCFNESDLKTFIDGSSKLRVIRLDKSVITEEGTRAEVAAPRFIVP